MGIMKRSKILLVVVSSTMGYQGEVGQEVFKKVSVLFEELKEDLENAGVVTNVIMADQIIEKLKPILAGTIIVVATGGTERIIKSIARSLEKPALLIAYPYNNSLASSMEVFSVLRDEGFPVKLIYSSLDWDILHDVRSFINVCKAIYNIENSKLIQIGLPSPWILTSKSSEIIKSKFGIDVIKLEISDLIESAKKIREDDAKNITNELKNKFGGIIEPKTEDLVKAAKFYLAIKNLISQYDASSITIRCFDLITYNVTACVGVSLSNDDGIVAGCETDLDSVLTMLILHELTKEPVWMANVARINQKDNTVTLAHCTIATKMLDDLKKSFLRNHFESGKSVSIQGVLKKSDITLVRLGGRNLDKMTIATGKIIKNDLNDKNLCRTQVEIKLNGDVEKLISHALGNHQILTYGNPTQELLDFCKFKNIEPIII
ncbi:MAG: hypothetical protein ACP5OK_06880 [Thermoprotei archaeon]